jgi:hypothetical protein
MTGKQVSQKFTLSAGLAVVQVQYHGHQGTFCVTVKTGLGKTIAMLLCPLTEYQLSDTDQREAWGVPQTGEYFLDVDEFGGNAWVVVISQSGFEVAPGQAPYTFVKRGRQVTPLFKLNTGPATFHMINAGTTGNFIVELMNASGAQIDLLANELQGADVTESVNIRSAGYYVLNVSADWDWRIEVKQP